MNERIKQLSNESCEHADSLFDTGACGDCGECEQCINWCDAQETKFAELIVKDCVTALEIEVDTWTEIALVHKTGAIKRQGARAIKEHFGIER